MHARGLTGLPLSRRHLLQASAGALPAVAGRSHAATFVPSYIAGARDVAGQFAGGTEMRLLVAHAGKLYAGNGYWEDRPGWEGWQGPQILVLGAPDLGWRVDHAFDERRLNGRRRDLAVGALASVTFTTDGAGHTLTQPVSVLVASTWDLTGASRVFTRDDANGTWHATTLAQDPTAPDFLPQIRSFGTHRDQVTGIDLAFAGQMPHGIFAGHYDTAAPGQISWAAAPELDASSVSTEFSGLTGRLRVSSFAEANGRLYAAVGQQIFERVDGAAPRWHLVYTNPRPGHSETGLRGLTAIEGGELLAAVEGNAARVVRIDPRSGSDTTELELVTLLARQWGMRVNYIIAAYNDMTTAALPGRGNAILFGLEAFVPRTQSIPAGHRVVDVGYGQVEGGAWYLVRWPDRRYSLRQIAARFPHPLVSTRSICRSPFPGDSDAIYFAGYDANKAPAHNTAWIVRTTLAAALGPER
jgi:hypothetical protein